MKDTLMVTTISAISRREKLMGKVIINGTMESIMMANGTKARKMAMENGNPMMEKLMLAIGRKEKQMVKADTFGQMVINMMEIGFNVSSMEKDMITLQMEINIPVNIGMENLGESEFISGRMAVFIKGNLKMV